MSDQDRMAETFEQHRPHLRGVAYRMLGSLTEADDALQDAWLRVSRADTGDVDDMRAWLTTVVARLCLNALRSRVTRREELLDPHVPDPIISPAAGNDPEHEALVADSVGLALLIVLDKLAPAERLAFVLHDIFDVPFEQIASIIDRSPAATRQLASRARRRLRTPPVAETDVAAQWSVVDAFLAAARHGDFEALLTVLDPDVVRRVDTGTTNPDAPAILGGARAVASSAIAFAKVGLPAQRVLVNGAPGAVTFIDGKAFAVLGFTVGHGRITEMNVLADPVRLRRLDLTALEPGQT